jgi:formate--tetrahydrofolate ligase
MSSLPLETPQDSVALWPISGIADRLGIPAGALEYYGKSTAKLRLELLDDCAARPQGKLILVTAITPTSHGEGKTVTSIGLAQALDRLGRTTIVTLREPSLGPVFGLKGGATGGGKSQVIPSDKINLHFNGDFHAVTSAHNLLAAMIDSHVYHGNRLGIDHIQWPRTIDMNDRALRHLIVGLGGKSNGTPRETGFVITAASEIMAILALSNSRADLRRRLNSMIVGFAGDGGVIRAGDLGCTGSMMVLLNEAIMPNLVQTTEHTAALVHAGPFANIAHGTSSVLAQKMALGLAEFVVNEAGFGADLGAEKYFDIVMPSSGLRPAAAVLVASARALHSHASHGDPGGFANLERHITNLGKFGVPVVVALNRFESDKQADLDAVLAFCADRGVACAITEGYARGADGGIDLATLVIEATSGERADVHPLYSLELGLAEKVEIIAREIYGADGVYFETAARKQLQKFEALGFGGLPVCIAKTQASFSDNPKLGGAPSGWTLTVTGAHVAAGAGFVVVIAGNMLLMPGLGKDPQAVHLDVDDGGEIVGLR